MKILNSNKIYEQIDLKLKVSLHLHYKNIYIYTNIITKVGCRGIKINAINYVLLFFIWLALRQHLKLTFYHKFKENINLSQMSICVSIGQFGVQDILGDCFK